MNSVPGLSAAIKSYTGPKVTERDLGQAQIKEIFRNQDNLDRFQNTAAREGGTGWVVFYQCLFQVVVADKRTALRAKKAGGAGEKTHIHADGAEGKS